MLANNQNSTPPPVDEKPLAVRILDASPLGVTAIVIGFILAVFFLFRFNDLTDSVENADLRAAIEALQIAVVSVWFGVVIWGWYLVRDGLERAKAYRRLNEQGRSLKRIEQAIHEMDRQKEVATQKSRSFWDWRRGETS